jgi:phenylalanyl-tRNA synthetase beta chain
MLNPLSQDLSVMRQSLLFSGLETVSYNINRRHNDLKLFEFGKTYHNYISGRVEDKHLSVFVSGNRNPEGWNSQENRGNFFYLKGVVESILDRLGINNLKAGSAKSDVFSEGIAMSSKKATLVEFGVVRKSVIKHFDIGQEVLFADFNWDAVIELVKTQKISFNTIPRYPAVRRDFALLLDESVKYEDIQSIASQTEKKFLKAVNLFDVYQGSNLPEGKKSYAVSFMFQDENKTLTDKQVDKIMNKLQQRFEKDLQAELR